MSAATKEVLVQCEPTEKGHHVGKRLRRMSSHLTPLLLKNDNNKNPFFSSLTPQRVTEAETQEEGKALFENFLADEIDRDSDIDEDIKDQLPEALR